MRFQDIPVAAGAAATADPRTLPASVLDALILEAPKTLPNTDTSPPYMALVLEGTATQTMDVTLWAKLETSGDPFVAEVAADRRFYKVAAAVTLTVGTMKTIPAVPGKYHLQLGAGPAAASVLRIGFMAAPIP